MFAFLLYARYTLRSSNVLIYFNAHNNSMTGPVIAPALTCEETEVHRFSFICLEPQEIRSRVLVLTQAL